jgi:hypothetical protein
MEKPFTTVVTSIPSKTAQTQAPRSSSGIKSILKLANIILNAENSAIGGGGEYSGGGGGGVDYTQVNMDFAQGLQNQTWSSVDSAAANWNVQ